MSIYKRKDTWWIQITTPDGRRIQQSARTKIKQEAQELHDRLKAEGWRIKSLGSKQRHTWQEAVVKLLSESGHKKSIDTDKFKLRWLDQHLRNLYLDEINKVKIDELKAAKKAQDVGNSTVNRTLELIRSILNRACKEWEWLDTVPNARLLPVQSTHIRWLTQEEIARLLTELPTYLQAMARLTLSTGLRESNVTGLQWPQLDMKRRCAWIHPD